MQNIEQNSKFVFSAIKHTVGIWRAVVNSCSDFEPDCSKCAISKSRDKDGKTLCAHLGEIEKLI